MRLFIAIFFLSVVAPAPAHAACIDITGEDWQAKLDAQFGNRICVKGRLYPNAHGVQFVVEPPWGNPPYGGLVDTDLTQREAVNAGIEGGEVVALRGLLIGNKFCRDHADQLACDHPMAKFYGYFLVVDKVPWRGQMQ